MGSSPIMSTREAMRNYIFFNKKMDREKLDLIGPAELKDGTKGFLYYAQNKSILQGLEDEFGSDKEIKWAKLQNGRSLEAWIYTN